MNNWSRALFGFAVFFGAAVMMLGSESSEWWNIVSIIVMLLAAVVFLTCSVIEYRRTRRVAVHSVGATPES